MISRTFATYLKIYIYIYIPLLYYLSDVKIAKNFDVMSRLPWINLLPEDLLSSASVGEACGARPLTRNWS